MQPHLMETVEKNISHFEYRFLIPSRNIMKGLPDFNVSPEYPDGRWDFADMLAMALSPDSYFWISNYSDFSVISEYE